ncbi:hypothetical protein BDQ94DRAFT_139017 [Aspergillus welwitschiae]|uniref:Uncharacterized protein n=1 Tax=Aspergillus welwitschiae TaxID=1341132 RepID=A0A3F3Q8X1_9EURO|nr:hypothetical protein BDQ94DRAFT_139017 [Aspergillus welwitschiae]RDH35684.1 hypothetical protein BDQ94DRAFT_139017 [Aspergillus welwitschiae]
MIHSPFSLSGVTSPLFFFLDIFFTLFYSAVLIIIFSFLFFSASFFPQSRWIK